MQKLKLNLDALAVESFNTTGGGAEPRGTVQAHRPIETQGPECESIDICTNWYCEPGTAVSECGTCATNCGSCYDATCGATYCGTCATNCGTCDPYCCCSCSCC